MEILLGAVFGLGILIGIPIMAALALSRSGQALRQIEVLRSQVAALRDALRARGEPLQDSARAEAVTAAAPAGTPVAYTAPAWPTEPEQPSTALPVDSPILRLGRRHDTVQAPDEPTPAAPPTAAAPKVGSRSWTPAIALSGGGAPFKPAVPPPPAASSRDIEESLGTRWAVWLGGLTLALGGLFLVKYSIDQGVFGPRVRIGSALVFALLLGAAGEWLRRSERQLEIGELPAAHIPGIVTAAGIVTAFGAVWAAHALYGMIGPAAAFVALGAIGLTALAASLAHGPILAALGLVGSYGTPFLVGSSEPNNPALVTYLAVVSAAVFAIAAARARRWIAASAVTGHAAWGGLLVAQAFARFAATGQRPGYEDIQLLIGLALAALFLVWRPERQGRPTASRDPLVVASLALPAALLVALAFVAGEERMLLVSGLAAVILLALTGAIFTSGVAGIAIAAVAAVGLIGAWPADGAPGLMNLVDPMRLLRLDFPIVAGGSLPLFAFVSSLAIAASGLLALARRSGSGATPGRARTTVAFTAALAPVAILAAATIRLNGLAQHRGAAMIALALAAALAIAGEWLHRDEANRRADPPAPDDLAGTGAFLSAAFVALGLAIALALPRLWLAVGLAIASAGTAFVLTRRPAPLLATLSGLLATAAVGRMIASPLLEDVGATPILNWLLAAYGLPALAFAAGAYVLRGREPASLRHLHEGLAIVFATITVGTEIRQFFVGPNLLAHVHIALGEVAVGAGAAALLALAAVETSRRQSSPAIDTGALALIALAATIALAGLGLAYNPLLSGEEVTGVPPFNRIGWGYGIPLAATAFAAWRLRRIGDRAVAPIAATLAALLTVAFVLLQVRRGFQGPQLHLRFGMTPAEAGTYVAAAFAASIVLDGLRRRTGSPVLAKGALLALFSGIVLAAVGPGLGVNPLLQDIELAGPILFDNALVGIALPSVIAGVAAWRFAPISRVASFTAGAAALLGGLLWLVVEVRRAFQGPWVWLGAASPGEAEWYAYSAALVLFGVALLAAGFWWRSRDLRLASAAVILAATVKVFLFDMAGLEGLWRALSFIGLGLVLIAIGLVYQRLLARGARENAGQAAG